MKSSLSSGLAFWRNIADRSPVPLALTAGECHEIVYANGAFGALRSVPPAALSGMAIQEGLPWSTRQPFLDLLNQVYRSGEPGTILDLAYPGSKEAYFGTVTVSPVAYGSELEQRQGLLVQIIDTTERVRSQRQLEQQSEELRGVNQALIVSSLLVQTSAEEAEAMSRRLYELVQGLGVAVWEADAQTFRYTFVSDSVERLFGYPISRWYREADLWAGMIDADDRQQVLHSLRKCALEQAECALDYRVLDAAGKVKWVRNLVNATRPLGASLRLRGVLIDITGLKLAEVSLRQQIQTLQHLDPVQAALLTRLADELRSPSAAMANSIHQLRQSEPAEVGRRTPLTILERQLRRQVRLLDNLQVFRDLTSAPLPRNQVPLNLTDLVSRTCEEQHATLRAAHLDFRLEVPTGPLWVKGDSVQLQQVLVNLLQYGIRFTPPGGCVNLSLGGTVDPRRALLTMQNSGTGIISEQIQLSPDRLINGSERQHNLDPDLTDLALAKTLVGAHGGEMWSTNNLSAQGIKVIIRLPLTAGSSIPAERPVAPARVKGPLLPRLRILIMDHDRDTTETLEDLLELNGHQVELAYTSKAGLEVARRFNPEVILCGSGLVELSGSEIATELHNDPTIASVPVIVITSSNCDEYRRRLVQAGFQLHLAKPVDLAAFEQLVSPLIRQLRSTESAQVIGPYSNSRDPKSPQPTDSTLI